MLGLYYCFIFLHVKYSSHAKISWVLLIPLENNKTTNTTFEPDLKQDLLNPGQDGHWLDLYPEFPENGHELP